MRALVILVWLVAASSAQGDFVSSVQEKAKNVWQGVRNGWNRLQSRHEEYKDYTCNGCRVECQFVSVMNLQRLELRRYQLDDGLNPMQCVAQGKVKCAQGKEHFYGIMCSKISDNPRFFIWTNEKGNFFESSQLRKSKEEK